MRRPDSVLISTTNMFPFVGLGLVLLIIFMIDTRPLCTKGVLIELQKVRNWHYMDAANRQDALMVGVMRDGKVYFDNEQVSPDMLRASLQAAENSHNGRLYLKVDARTRYKVVKDVLDTVPANLAQRISFLTD